MTPTLTLMIPLLLVLLSYRECFAGRSSSSVDATWTAYTTTTRDHNHDHDHTPRSLGLNKLC